MVPIFLRIESITVIIFSLFLYFHYQGIGWWLIPLFIIPDLFMFGYLINKQIGAIIYNLAHTYVFPLSLLLIGIYLNHPLTIQLSSAWIFHIAVDRLIGYGLKYPTDFKNTHLQKIYK